MSDKSKNLSLPLSTSNGTSIKSNSNQTAFNCRGAATASCWEPNSLSSHASSAETSETVSFPSRKYPRNREPATYPPSDRNKSPAATEDRGCATAAAGCRASHSTEISTPRPFRSPLIEYRQLEVPNPNLAGEFALTLRKQSCYVEYYQQQRIASTP
jgi:hypothetical protein